MPNYPIFYSIQNDKDSSTNVFSLNFNDQIQGDEVLKLRHILNEIPLDLQTGNYHIRFKIQCNETEPKIFAWIDPQNLEARAPIINNAVYVKILQLTKDGDSKIYNKQKIAKIKEKGSQSEQQKEQKKQPPIQNTQKPKQQHVSQTNIHHSNSDPDLVHKQHMKSSNILDEEFKDTSKSSQFKQKSSTNLDSQQQKIEKPQTKKTVVKNHLDDDDNDIPPQKQQQQQQQPSQVPPAGAGINFFDSDDEGAPSGAEKSPTQPNYSQNNPLDLFSDETQKPSYQVHENLLHQNQAPISEYERKLQSKKNEYIINGEIDREKLIEVKKIIEEEVQELRKKEYEEEEQKRAQDQIDKRSAQERFEGKIKSWKEQNGTRKDIRTLLSTLQNILWPGANWNPVSFFDLSTEESLKAAIKKVLLTFHPDRNRNDIEKKYICEQIIDEIRKAQKEYESKQQK